MKPCLSKPGHGIICWPLAKTFACVQKITMTEITIQGIQPCQLGMARAIGVRPRLLGPFTAEAPSGAAAFRGMMNSGSGAGAQRRRNSKVMTSDVSEEKTSVRA